MVQRSKLNRQKSGMSRLKSGPTADKPKSVSRVKHSVIILICTICTFMFSVSFSQLAYTVSPSGKEMYEKAQTLIHQFPDSALNIAHQLIQDKSYREDVIIFAKGNYLIGTANLIKGKYIIAGEYLLNAIHTDHGHDDKIFAEACWNNLGIAYDYQQKYDEAIKAYQKSLEITTELKDSASMMQSIINLGLLDHKVGNRDKAIQRFQQALAFFSMHNDSIHAGLCLENIGKIHADAGDYHLAIPLYQKALKFFDASGYLPGKTEIWLNLAKSYHDTGKTATSMRAVEEMLALNKDLGNMLHTGMGIQILGANYLTMKQYKKAELYLLDALNIFEEEKQTDRIESTLQLLKNLYAQAGDYSQYKVYEKRLEEVRSDHRNRLKIQVYNELAELYEHERHIHQIAEQKAVLKSKSNQMIGMAVALMAVSGLAIYTVTRQVPLNSFKKFFFLRNIDKSKSKITNPVTEPMATSEESRIQEIYRNIIDLLQTQKLYRDSNLSVTSLAMELNTNERYISRAINRHSHSNFTALINKYRVDEACTLLQNKNNRLKVSIIAKRVGYGDPSTFYRHFKEITGLTPAQFAEMNDGMTAEPNPAHRRNIKNSDKAMKTVIGS